MSERAWAWVVWIGSLLAIALIAVPTYGFTLAFVPLWWMGGPFHLAKVDGRWGPFWDPPRPRKLGWREIR